MIYVLLKAEHDYTITKYLASGGQAQAGRLTPLPWRRALRQRRLPGGTYVFTDFERLRPEALRWASTMADTLEADEGARLLNHPARWVPRYELLRRLHDEGTNPYAAYRLSELPASVRFPVFVRLGSDHQGARSELLHTRAEIDAAVSELKRRRKSMDDVLVIEFQETVDELRQYRKYGAFRVGDRIVPRHLFFGGSWCLKGPSNHRDEQFDEEEAYMRDNPHRDELMRVFTLAGLDYGRIDYAMVDGRICVWEVNSNPMISIAEDATTGRPGQLNAWFHAAFADAWREIDRPSSGAIAMPPRKLLDRLRGR